MLASEILSSLRSSFSMGSTGLVVLEADTGKGDGEMPPLEAGPARAVVSSTLAGALLFAITLTLLRRVFLLDDLDVREPDGSGGSLNVLVFVVLLDAFPVATVLA